MNNKKMKKRGPQKFKKRRGPGFDVTHIKSSRWLPVIPPHCVDNFLSFEEGGGDSVPE